MLLVPLEAVILGEMGFMHVISDYSILRVGLEPLPAFVSAVTAAYSLPYLFSFFFTRVRLLGPCFKTGRVGGRHRLAWRIPWTKKPGGLQSIGSQKVGHD